ncbi:MAG: prepilin-type N-terminal cleavage/methylation domain-containing protein [Candidatus Omnitrophica bacterium]|nr:prepilin-type N-terminal cleavage/methylation domain-containing protein [Candidatus Omnitrophota bacterium]
MGENKLEIRSLTGFTLVEIMTVLTIVGLLAAMAIPNLLRARLNTNEVAAQAALRTLSSAMTAYRTVNPTYPSNLQQLGPTSGGGEALSYIDDTLAQGAKFGYNFVIESSDAYTYVVRAAPQTSGVTGNRVFTMAHDGSIQLAQTDTTNATIVGSPGDSEGLTSDPQGRIGSSVSPE